MWEFIAVLLFQLGSGMFGGAGIFAILKKRMVFVKGKAGGRKRYSGRSAQVWGLIFFLFSLLGTFICLSVIIQLPNKFLLLSGFFIYQMISLIFGYYQQYKYFGKKK
ncbi:MAG: hypothetical protein WCJ58_05420 [bacterium]